MSCKHFTILVHFTNFMDTHDILVFFSVTYCNVGIRVDISFVPCYVLLIILTQ